MSSNSHRIVTRRLTLEPHSLRDFEDVLAMRGDPDVSRFLGGVMNREDVRSRILRNIGLWASVDLGYWVARETETARFVGEFGFADYHRDTTPSFAGTPEVGWVAAADFVLVSETALFVVAHIALGTSPDGAVTWHLPRTIGLRKGKGFASEAVTAILAWGDQQASFERTVCMISTNNLPSLRIADKFGYRAFSDVIYKGNRDLLLERSLPT